MLLPHIVSQLTIDLQKIDKHTSMISAATVLQCSLNPVLDTVTFGPATGHIGVPVGLNVASLTDCPHQSSYSWTANNINNKNMDDPLFFTSTSKRRASVQVTTYGEHEICYHFGCMQLFDDEEEGSALHSEGKCCTTITAQPQLSQQQPQPQPQSSHRLPVYCDFNTLLVPGVLLSDPYQANVLRNECFMTVEESTTTTNRLGSATSTNPHNGLRANNKPKSNDSAHSGCMTFAFYMQVFLLDLGLLDMEDGATITLYSDGHVVDTIASPRTGDNGYLKGSSSSTLNHHDDGSSSQHLPLPSRRAAIDAMTICLHGTTGAVAFIEYEVDTDNPTLVRQDDYTDQTAEAVSAMMTSRRPSFVTMA